MSDVIPSIVQSLKRDRGGSSYSSLKRGIYISLIDIYKIRFELKMFILVNIVIGLKRVIVGDNVLKY